MTSYPTFIGGFLQGQHQAKADALQRFEIMRQLRQQAILDDLRMRAEQRAQDREDRMAEQSNRMFELSKQNADLAHQRFGLEQRRTSVAEHDSASRALHQWFTDTSKSVGKWMDRAEDKAVGRRVEQLFGAADSGTISHQQLGMELNRLIGQYPHKVSLINAVADNYRADQAMALRPAPDEKKAADEAATDKAVHEQRMRSIADEAKAIDTQYSQRLSVVTAAGGTAATDERLNQLQKRKQLLIDQGSALRDSYIGTLQSRLSPPVPAGAGPQGGPPTPPPGMMAGVMEEAKPPGARIVVTNGIEEREIDVGDLNEAIADGFQPKGQ